MSKFLHNHGLTVVLVVIYLCFKIPAIGTTPDQEFWYATLHGHSDDAFGAILLVLATKWWREKGSAESK
jgi:hypothetical protein